MACLLAFSGFYETAARQLSPACPARKINLYEVPKMPKRARRHQINDFSDASPVLIYLSYRHEKVAEIGDFQP